MNKKFLVWIFGVVFLISLVIAFQLHNNEYFVRASFKDNIKVVLPGWCTGTPYTTTARDIDYDGDGFRNYLYGVKCDPPTTTTNCDDACPGRPEIISDIPGTNNDYCNDGCPDKELDTTIFLDPDCDGIANGLKENPLVAQFDDCPGLRETYFGGEEDPEDGCPIGYLEYGREFNSYDIDLDGITNDVDQCYFFMDISKDQETWNGYKDEDGCPDELPSPYIACINREYQVVPQCRSGGGYTTCITPPIAVSLKADGTPTDADNFLDIGAFNGDFSMGACQARGYKWRIGINPYGCCGDDFTNDLGSVETKTYYDPYLQQNVPYEILCDFCTRFDCKDSLSGWWWADADAERYTIYGVNKLGIEYDMISNSQEWYYCNANSGNQNLKTASSRPTGRAVAEGPANIPEASLQTLYDQKFGEGRLPCPLPSPYGNWNEVPEEWSQGTTYDLENKITPFYCTRDSYRPGHLTQDCGCKDIATGNLYQVCTIPEIQQAVICDTSSTATQSGNVRSEKVLKKDCTNDVIRAGGCVKNMGTGDVTKGCLAVAQELTTSLGTPLTGVICPAQTLCTDGTVVSSSDTIGGSTCCVGESVVDATTNCKPISTVSSCTELRGSVFNPSIEGCENDNSVELQGGINCCLDPDGVYYLEERIYDDFQEDISAGFLCYKQEGKDYFGECCYSGKCVNNENPDIRTFGEGGQLHSLGSFDTFVTDTTTGKTDFLDYVWKSRLTPNTYISSNKFISTPSNWSGYKYGSLELDVVYSNTPSKLFIMYDDDKKSIDMGALTRWSTNGDAPERWHHISIPMYDILRKLWYAEEWFFRGRQVYARNLRDTADIVLFSEIRAYTEQDTDIVVDNFYLKTQGSDTETKTYYCAGEINRWVDSINPPAGITEPKDLWPYRKVCGAFPSFGWTGTKCCGVGGRDVDYYVDEEAGCWANFRVRDDETIDEVTRLPTNYPNMLFKETNPATKFLVCTRDQNEAYTLPTDKLTKGTDVLPTEFCRIEGTHYCSNLPDRRWLTHFKLIKSNDLIETAELDSWTPRNMTMESIPSDITATVTQSCCPYDTCWNGTVCVKGINGEKVGDLEFFSKSLYDSNTFAFTQPFENEAGVNDNTFCMMKNTTHAEWTSIYRRESWDYPANHPPPESSIGLTNDSNSCWTGDVMVPNGWYTDLLTTIPNHQYKDTLRNQKVGDHLCENGEWTSRVKYIAETLLNYSGGEYTTDYVFYCDSYDDVLNNYGRGELATTLAGDATTNFCVIQYEQPDDEIKTVFAVGLNKGFQDTTYTDFKQELGDPDCSDAIAHTTAETFGEFKDCVGKKLWYNNELKVLVFSQSVIDSIEHKFLEEFFASPFKTIFNWLAGLVTGGVKIVAGVEAKDFVQSYINVKPVEAGTKEIRGIIERLVVEDTINGINYNITRNVMTINYTGYPITDACANLPLQITCDTTQGAIYSESQTAIDTYWPQLTAQVRTD